MFYRLWRARCKKQYNCRDQDARAKERDIPRFVMFRGDCIRLRQAAGLGCRRSRDFRPARYDLHWRHETVPALRNRFDELSAARALAELTREPVPDTVIMAYGGKTLKMGPDYFIPKPFDPRVLWWVAPAVAQAAMESGVARNKLDLADYTRRLEEMVANL